MQRITGLSGQVASVGSAEIEATGRLGTSGHANIVRGYLRAETIGPLPSRRLAVARPQTADTVFCKILRQPRFTWAGHGQALRRRRKPWYYEHEPRPDMVVLGARLSELIGR